MRAKRGDVRDDGLVFLRRKGGAEVWVGRDTFNARTAKDKEWRTRNYEANKELLKAKAREHWNKVKDREDIKARAREQSARFRQEKPELNRRLIVEWEKRNPEKVKATKLRWVKKNPKKVLGYRITAENNRRARKKQNGGQVAIDEMKAIRKAAGGKCHYCKKKAPLTFDHVVPIAKGGQHSADNLVMACKSCNCSKGAKHPHDYARKLGRLLI